MSLGQTVTANGNGATTSAQPIQVDVNVPQPKPELLGPVEAYQYVAYDGAKKAAMTPFKTFVMALYAGAYIAFGGFLGLTVCNGCPGETRKQLVSELCASCHDRFPHPIHCPLQQHTACTLFEWEGHILFFNCPSPQR